MLRYTQDSQPVWELPAAGVLVIGESTNGGGANGKEHTYCFVDENGTWFDASVHAAGLADSVAALGEAVGANLGFTLAAAPAFQSRVLWPPRLIGKPLFKFTITPLTGFLNKLLRNVSVEQRFSDEVSNYVDPVQEETSYSGPLVEVDEDN
jgi:hypothetical protein